MTTTNDTLAGLLASSCSGVLARFPCHPLDTCKARLQVQSTTDLRYKNVWDVLRQTFRTEGLRGLYRGFGVTVIGSAPATCLYLSSYDAAKNTLSSNAFVENQFLAHFAAGMIAETVSCVLWVPIDVTKERLQIQETRKGHDKCGARNHTNYRGSIDALRTIMRTEGLRGIYKGYGATVGSFGPFSAFYFMFYEQIKSSSVKLYYNTPDPDDVDEADIVRDPPFWLHLINSSVASMMASFVTNPLDLVKLRLQVQRGAAVSSMSSGRAAAAATSASKHVHHWGQYKGMLDGLRQVCVQEGAQGLFRGVGARMAFHGPSIAITISAYEKLKVWWKDVL